MLQLMPISPLWIKTLQTKSQLVSLFSCGYFGEQLASSDLSYVYKVWETLASEKRLGWEGLVGRKIALKAWALLLFPNVWGLESPMAFV